MLAGKGVEPVLNKVRVAGRGSGRPRTRPDRVRADKAYASRKNRAYLRRRGIRCTIPDKWGINRPQGHRVVARRYDWLAVRYEATVLVAAINEWL
ncbi:hypothetical protein ACFY6U_18350 [Streptomyces sp. NPDC013157]|uniref:hypothetical protein n=1 Tax=Streptomyces sp. NPDC013157 TaxID=3364861 RepID=UPI003674B2B7